MDIGELREKVIERRKETPDDRACLVGISGVDASGKGYVSSRLGSQLEAAGQRVALINVDGWLNLPRIRFIQTETPLLDRRGADASAAGWWRNDSSIHSAETNEGEHFYHHALRLDEMFERLILPLKQNREADLAMDFAEETATEFRPHTYAFADIDIILLEGIFIFKRQFVQRFDLKIWIECSFETALMRAIARGQENLSPNATIEGYENIYFPAQRLHFQIDEPRETADLVFRNEQF